MAHWFHRNQLKATAPVKFEMKMVVVDSQAMAICNQLRQARSSLLDLLCDLTSDTAKLEDHATKYLALLHGLIVDDKGKESNLRYSLRFRWTHSVLGSTPIPGQDVLYEVISVCQNVAIWLMKHASTVAGKEDITMDEAKEVHKCLRKASGIFVFVRDQLMPQLSVAPEIGSDLDPHVVACYIHQCTAEAQEVTIARAVELKHAPSLISALAHETSNMFGAAANELREESHNGFKKWRKYLHLKATFYLSFAYCYAGENLLAQDKCGDAIRSLQESEKCYATAAAMCKEYSQMKGPGTSAKPDQHLFFRKLLPVVRLTLSKCQTENGIIYHQRIPENPPELELQATYGLVSPEDFKLPAPSELWTPVAYAAFDTTRIAQQDPANSKAAAKAEGDLPPVKEKEGPQSTTDPKNNSGCILQ